MIDLKLFEQRFMLYLTEIRSARRLQQAAWATPADVEKLEEFITDLQIAINRGCAVLNEAAQKLDEVMPEF